MRLPPALLVAFLAAAWTGQVEVRVTAAPAAVLSAEALYADAMAKEAAVRQAIEATPTATTVLKAIRTVIADYEALVRRYPASAYCDDALWRAAQLSRDGFALFKDGREQTVALRLLQSLQSQYPTSKWVRQAPEQIAGLRAASPAPPSRAAPEPATEPSQTPAGATTKIATIKDIRRAVVGDTVRVVIELDQEVTFHDERLDNPARVFVDLAATRASERIKDQTIRFETDADRVRQVRIGRHPNNTTRVVLEAAGISSYSVYPLYSPYRLVIDCLRDAALADVPRAEPEPVKVEAVRLSPEALVAVVTDPPPLALDRRPLAATAPTRPVAVLPAPAPSPVLVPAPPPARVPAPRTAATTGTAPVATSPRPAPMPVPAVPRPPTVSYLVALRFTTAMNAYPTSTPLATAAIVEALTEIVPPSLPASPVVAPGDHVAAPLPLGAPSRNLAGGLSIARQLGLGVSRIVIDPGHGGHDSGAKGGGTTESDLVLDIATRLEKLFHQVADIEVVLTRRDDSFVTLQERTAIANRENADLFLSIHANASNSAQVHGVETYFLNFASNLSAAAVAARENAASGQSMGELPDVVKTIALNNKLDESRDFATFVQRELVTKLRPANKDLRDLGVKQAPFVVLIGAAMPSVLAEVSFLTNSQEARLLKGSAYRQKIAEALFDAVRKYQSTLGAAVSNPQRSQQ